MGHLAHTNTLLSLLLKVVALNAFFVTEVQIVNSRAADTICQHFTLTFIYCLTENFILHRILALNLKKPVFKVYLRPHSGLATLVWLQVEFAHLNEPKSYVLNWRRNRGKGQPLVLQVGKGGLR